MSSNLIGDAKYTFTYTKRRCETSIEDDGHVVSGWISDVVLGVFDVVQIDAIKSGEVVGFVELIKTNHGHWETHVYVDEDERGKGLGIILFTKAFNYCLRRNQILMSSTHTSEHAHKLWQSKRLNKKYTIEIVPSVPAITTKQFWFDNDYDNTPAKRDQHQYKLTGRFKRR